MLDNLSIIFRAKENCNESEKEAEQEKRIKDMEKLMMKQTETISKLSERIGEQSEAISRYEKQFKEQSDLLEQKQEEKYVPVKEPRTIKKLVITGIALALILGVLFSLYYNFGIAKNDDIESSIGETGVFSSLLSIASIVIISRDFSEHRKNIDDKLRIMFAIYVYVSIFIIIFTYPFNNKIVLFLQIFVAWFSLVSVGIILVNKILGDHEHEKYQKEKT